MLVVAVGSDGRAVSSHRFSSPHDTKRLKHQVIPTVPLGAIVVESLSHESSNSSSWCVQVASSTLQSVIDVISKMENSWETPYLM